MISLSHQEEEEQAPKKRKKSNVVSDSSKEAAKKKAKKTTHKHKATATTKAESTLDLSTPEGQLKANPEMSLQEAKSAAKREYNRLNAARARQRNKMTVEQLHGRITELQNTVEQLQRANQGLTAQLSVLTQQNRTLVLQQVPGVVVPQVLGQAPQQQQPPQQPADSSNSNTTTTTQQQQPPPQMPSQQQVLANILQPQQQQQPVDILFQLQQLLGQQQQAALLQQLLMSSQPQDLASQLLQGLPSHAIFSMLQQQQQQNQQQQQAQNPPSKGSNASGG